MISTKCCLWIHLISKVATPIHFKGWKRGGHTTLQAASKISFSMAIRIFIFLLNMHMIACRTWHTPKTISLYMTQRSMNSVRIMMKSKHFWKVILIWNASLRLPSITNLTDRILDLQKHGIATFILRYCSMRSRKVCSLNI